MSQAIVHFTTGKTATIDGALGVSYDHSFITLTDHSSAPVYVIRTEEVRSISFIKE
jgi:hypothetical protein